MRRPLGGSMIIATMISIPVVSFALPGCAGTPPADPGAGGGPATSATTPAGAASTPTPGTASSPTSGPTAVPTATPKATLPPPPAATEPAAKTAGALGAEALPRPAGWRPVARAGGAEEGYEGNGTWVHAKDPRYAARDLITIGCAPVGRDDYPDPTAALEGSYVRRGAPGVGLVLQFADRSAARSYFARYTAQVAACTDPSGPVVAERVPSDLGLVDHRSYPDGDWTEMAAVRGSRATFVILTDPGHRITRSAAEAVLTDVAR